MRQPTLEVDPWAEPPPARHTDAVPAWARLVAPWAIASAPLCARWFEESGSIASTVVQCLALLVALAITRRAMSREPWAWVGAAVAIAIGAVAASTDVAPFAWSVTAAFLTARALEPPTRRWTPPGDRPVVVGVTIGLVSASTISMIRGGPGWLQLVLLAAAAAALAVDRQLPRASFVLHRWVARGVVRVIELVGAGALFIVVSVAMYLPGALGSALERMRRQRAKPTYWSVVPEAPRAGDENRPFRSASLRQRGLRLLSALLLLPVAAWVTFEIARPEQRPGSLDGSPSATRASGQDDPAVASGEAALAQIERTSYGSRPAFADMPFADAMQDELQGYTFVEDELTGYGRGEFSGRFTNVGPNGRATLAPDCPKCPSSRVWLVGGSTAFGLGQRDDHTVASGLVRAAAQTGIALEVTNLGVPGWTLDQELADLERRLADPDVPPPDLVVFLDGFNDTAAATFDAAFGRRPGTTTVLDPSDSIRFLGGAGDPVSSAASRRAGSAAAESYRSRQQEADRRLEERGIAVRHFFQPDAFATPVQSEYLPTYYAPAPDLLERMDLGAALSSAAAGLEPDVVSLRNVFDAEQSTVFADMVHVNEHGAALIADAMWAVILPQLRRT